MALRHTHGTEAETIQKSGRYTTVIKNHDGAFFPLYGLWMKQEENTRWPFDPVLPKWFAQRRLMVDPKFRHQWKTRNAIKVTDEWESADMRRQLPGKRRLAEQVVVDRPDLGEEVVCRYPVVSLPGVRDIIPFEDSGNLTIQKPSCLLKFSLR